MRARHRIAITGGGTGGHVYPALAVHDQLRGDPEVEAILYIGAKGHLEERLAAERKIDFVGLASAGLPRKLSPALLSWPFKMGAAILAARSALKQFKPTVVLGTGGYASAPPLAAARLLSVPYAIHEPDAYPGLVNRLFSTGASLCSLGMEGAKARLHNAGARVFVNGNPVSGRFKEAPPRQQAATFFNLNPELLTLFVTGGSQGAQAVNEAVLEALPDLLSIEPPMQILHQVGDKNFSQFKERIAPQFINNKRYQIRPYIDDITVAYAIADLAVSRAGAMTIADLAVSGTPAILIPYPFAAQDHQTSNARYIEAQGGAIVIAQSDLTGQTLAQTVRSLSSDAAKLAAMRQAISKLGRPDAAADIARQLKNLSAEYQTRQSDKQRRSSTAS